MNALLIHLAAMECFKRSSAAGVKPTAFIVLQALAAEDPTAKVYPSTLVTSTGLHLATVYDVLNKLEKQGLIAFSARRSGGKAGRPAFLLSLTPQGLSIMTPVRLPENDAATLNTWSHSKL